MLQSLPSAQGKVTKEALCFHKAFTWYGKPQPYNPETTEEKLFLLFLSFQFLFFLFFFFSFACILTIKPYFFRGRSDVLLMLQQNCTT